jgi:hypothetical protein
MEKSELRREVLKILREESQTHVNAIEARLRQRCETYERGDALRLQEIIWELLMQGILAPGKNSLNLHLPFVHVTAYGARCLEEHEILIHDPTGYLEQFAQGTAPELIRLIHEALRCFLSGHPTASVVLLSAAGERLIDALAAAAVATQPSGHTQGTVRGRLTKAGRDLFRRTEIVREQLLALRPGGTNDSEIELHLGDLVALFRLTRDDRGLPVAPPVDRERAHAALLTFPSTVRWCRAAIDALAECLEARSHSVGGYDRNAD